MLSLYLIHNTVAMVTYSDIAPLDTAPLTAMRL